MEPKKAMDVGARGSDVSKDKWNIIGPHRVFPLRRSDFASTPLSGLVLDVAQMPYRVAYR